MTIQGRWWLIFAACLMLTGCGFHLRRSADLPPVMQRTYIAAPGGNTELVRELRRNLTTAATSVIDDPATASAVLNIVSARQYQRVLSVSNTGQPLEYEVAYQVTISLSAGGKTLIDNQMLTLTRTYAYDVANVLGDAQQANVLYSALARNMAQLILFRLEAAGRKSSAKGSP